MNFPIEIPALQRALTARGYIEPTSVQSAVLADDATGRDLLVSAQTGSGKTIAYGLAFASTIMNDGALPPPTAPLALIIAPTRELAIQVHAELAWLYEFTGARVVSCVGGMDPRREQRALAAGCHIVVGTPGRLQDHLERRHLDVSALKVVVLDEADEMLDLGFRDELEFILGTTPAERRTLLFSATIAREIAALARQYQRDAFRIDTVARNQPHADIEYRAIRVAAHEIEHGLVNLLRFHERGGCLVFCSTREAVRQLHGRLQERGFAVVALSGELSQTERNTALQSLRDGRARVCIATDVAARGLDLPNLDLVIHADLPNNKAILTHRSGRTGRAGRKGLCVLLVPNSRRRQAEALLASANIKASWDEPPSADSIRARDQARLLTDPLLTEPPLDDDLTAGRELLGTYTPETIATALIRLYRGRLPSPEDISPLPPDRPRFENTREPRHHTATPGGAPMVWFRADVGRRKNADPKWLLPLICRVGGVTKRDIGAIRIFDRETKFEIHQSVADDFMKSVIAVNNPEIHIETTTGPTPDAIGATRPGTRKPGAPPPWRKKAATPPHFKTTGTDPVKPNEQARRRRNKAKSGA
ncbi:DEAD/DEAH box helicase [Acidiphilium sp. PA]|uniref:DEAD/DEAH box helicase n=1 Tax=Acidiphilium sp. PA TaxID=2871705 RepID=UPI0022441F58|nr:DEAD/DEAH box helicase [Acidiphilium sp. PA]MCW8307327.1 DEAD/DEAH box helicase [Acidiphilium sp. PA]